MTKLERATRKAIREWCEVQGYTVKKIDHVFPRAYVVARPGINSLVVAVPPFDAYELSPAYDFGSETMIDFDCELKVGEWCSVAYVLTKGWGGPVAIPAVVVED